MHTDPNNLPYQSTMRIPTPILTERPLQDGGKLFDWGLQNNINVKQRGVKGY